MIGPLLLVTLVVVVVLVMVMRKATPVAPVVPVAPVTDPTSTPAVNPVTVPVKQPVPVSKPVAVPPKPVPVPPKPVPGPPKPVPGPPFSFGVPPYKPVPVPPKPVPGPPFSFGVPPYRPAPVVKPPVVKPPVVKPPVKPPPVVKPPVKKPPVVKPPVVKPPVVKPPVVKPPPVKPPVKKPPVVKPPMVKPPVKKPPVVKPPVKKPPVVKPPTGKGPWRVPWPTTTNKKSPLSDHFLVGVLATLKRTMPKSRDPTKDWGVYLNGGDGMMYVLRNTGDRNVEAAMKSFTEMWRRTKILIENIPKLGRMGKLASDDLESLRSFVSRAKSSGVCPLMQCEEAMGAISHAFATYTPFPQVFLTTPQKEETWTSSRRVHDIMSNRFDVCVHELAHIACIARRPGRPGCDGHGPRHACINLVLSRMAHALGLRTFSNHYYTDYGRQHPNCGSATDRKKACGPWPAEFKYCG